MKNKKLFLVGTLLIAGILLAACGGGAAPSTDAGTQDTEEATPVSSDSGASTDATEAAAPSVDLNLDPANMSGENAESAAAYLYEGLVRDQDGTVTGALAETITVSEDGLDYIFDLRQGVSFHDGASLNADAVVLNFNRWFDPSDANRGSGEYAAWAANFGGFKGEVTEEGKPKSWVDGIEKVNEFSVIVHLNAVDPDFLTKLTNRAFSIISPATFAGGDGGSGAYRAVSNDGTTLTLEPFAGYWDAAAIPGENMEVPAP
jgi:peptide/nickel transport system substrate-binding protein